MKNMKLIPLFDGMKLSKKQEFAKVDDEDFEWVNKFKWYIIPDPDGNLYAFRPYKKENGRLFIIEMGYEIYWHHENKEQEPFQDDYPNTNKKVEKLFYEWMKSNNDDFLEVESW
jgi:hypothetical protein